MYRAIHTTAPFALMVVVVLFLSAVQLRLISNNFDEQLDEHIKAAQGVVEGLPHWRLYQSRVLGPYMVYAVERATGWTPQKAYNAMMFVWLAAFFAVLVTVAQRMWHSHLLAIAIAAGAALLNAMLMQGKWLYPWDFIDLTIFTLLTWAVMFDKPLSVIAGILLVEMFNREASTIVAGWLVIDAMLAMVNQRMGYGTANATSARRQIAVAVVLIIVSLATTEALRSALFVREVGPELFPADTRGPGLFAAVQLGWNIGWLRHTVASLPNTMIVDHCIILAIPTLSVIAIVSRAHEIRRVGTLVLVLWTFTLLFGLINETRVWLMFVPFLVLAGPKIAHEFSFGSRSSL